MTEKDKQEVHISVVESDNDEFVENGISSAVDKDINKELDTSNSHHWIHAGFHCLVVMLGTGILGFPYATQWLGWVGASILIVGVTLSAYYTATLLSSLQEPGLRTYTDIAKSCSETELQCHMKFVHMSIRPFQFFVFFPTSSVMILIGGQAMQTIDLMAKGATISYAGCGYGYAYDTTVSTISSKVWSIIMGAIVMILSQTKDMEQYPQISAIGTLSVFMIVAYCIVGSGIALADDNVEASYNPEDCGSMDNNTYVARLLTAFGSIIFGYGFHSVLPDIQNSLGECEDDQSTRKDMKRAIRWAFSVTFPSYLTVALVGFAAFGVDVATDLLISMSFVLSNAAMYVIWVFVIIKTSTEATIYNQSAFAMIDDVFSITKKSTDIAIRVIWTVVCTLVAMYIPFFNDLTAVCGAVSLTPLSFVYPVIFWNSKHGNEASALRVWFHYLFIFVWGSLGFAALIGAIWDISLNVQDQDEG